jgi:hypothetical protein
MTFQEIQQACQVQTSDVNNMIEWLLTDSIWKTRAIHEIICNCKHTFAKRDIQYLPFFECYPEHFSELPIDNLLCEVLGNVPSLCIDVLMLLLTP